ncbi:DNA topoisomerase [Pyronema omphalodes]|nr:DNA topoisomerase [Pyronema omphalodes]
MPGKILCIAEKPSIAKAVAGHLSGGQFSVRDTQNRFVKNYEFTYQFAQPWGRCHVVMSSVMGHTLEWDFEDAFRSWKSCSPSHLFDARTKQFVGKRTDIVGNIKDQARGARALFIWTDCDREGEYIGTEVRDIVKQVNPTIEVKRARFSNIERAHILQAAQRPVDIDERQAQAVSARIELDLRIGAAFTRWQTAILQSLPDLANQGAISYGSCQFPTLGFVVDRYKKVKNFVPEPFWYIKVMHKKDDVSVTFNWDRNRLFDRMSTVILYERCIDAKTATITKVETKPSKKWKPLPLTTVELQKMGSRFLGLSSKRTMDVAEKLYTGGFISYPRTETDQFDRAINLRGLIEKQVPSQQWGQFATHLLNGGFSSPRDGKNNDKAHPPIHPIAFANPIRLETDDRKVYEFICRRFLACCSEDAVGALTTVRMTWGVPPVPESFHATGLRVIARNYLDVYPYDKWESSQQLPEYREGETFIPTEALMMDGKTTAPSFLTEPELIALMDVNGIGTDATMAEHIAKIQERQYVFARSKGGGRGGGGDGAAAPAARGRGRGGRGGRGRGRGRGGSEASSGSGGGGVQEFVPSSLGLGLAEGYDAIGFENSLSKPFLRKEMEERLKMICEGRLNKSDMLQATIDEYREMFARSARGWETLRNTVKGYLEG